tara:strand:- start:273 stop:1385 length:1113 start_codon:yes stop_codon:yes gene_type:complete
MAKNTEARIDSTQQDDSVATDSRTEDQMLADIVRNSAFTEGEESLPSEQIPEADTDETIEEDPEIEESEEEEVEEEVETEDEETEAEDDDNESSTEEADVYSQDELDLDAQVVVKIDGKDMSVSFSDLIKGYSTEQSLSNKGRELGDARKKLEEEYQTKVKEINDIGMTSSAILYQEEQKYSKEYHDIEAKIDEARKENDTYKVSELKDQREQAQKEYWKARSNREGILKNVQTQMQEQNQKQWDEQLKNFNEVIPTLIPEFNDNTAKAIREFAVAEGVKEEFINTITDPYIVKFVDDYRKLKQGVTKGTAKRKTVATRKAPVKKAKTKTQKEIDQATQIRDRAFSEDASNEDQMAFLRGYAEQSLGNNI